MTKTDLIEKISRRISHKKKDIQAVVDLFLEEINASLLRDEEVSLKGFGSFYRVEKKARKIHSPIKKGVVDVPAKKTTGFRPCRTTERPC